MLYIGIDLGGTSIKVGAVDATGSILAEASLPTFASRPYQDIVRDMMTCAREALAACGASEDDVAAIGVGIPGVADQHTGVVVFCTNLAWHDVPLREEIQKYMNRPVFIDNDATVAGFAESVAGVSRGAHSSVFLTLGTGLGSGVVIGGRPWSGAHGVGAEFGHTTLEIDGEPCTCGNFGCVERYCSATALIRMAREACRAHPACEMLRACEGDASRINAKLVIDLAKEGDDMAVRLFRRYVKYLALAVNNIITFLDPEVVVLGGGVSRAGNFLLDAVRAEIPRYLMYKTLPCSRVELARLGSEAGIIGAAMLGSLQ